MIQNIRIQYYKAIHDSKALPIPQFTVFIGNNGSGKSSVFEALQLLQEAVLSDINTAFSRWGGLENVRNNKGTLKSPGYPNSIFEHRFKTRYRKEYASIEISLTCKLNKQTYKYTVGFNISNKHDFYLAEHESLHVGKSEIFRSQLQDEDGNCEVRFKLSAQESALQTNVDSKESAGLVVKPTTLRYLGNRLFISGLTFSIPQECLVFRNYIINWQFLAINAHTVGYPITQNRLTSEIRLQSDGRNLADFIRHIARSPDRLDSLIEKMKFVLPYASDIQTQTSEDFDRKIQLRLYEEGQKTAIPGWLFSSGTLRILAILAVLESPNPPTALFIDEVENGLDPRTIGLLINEFQQQYASRQTQIVVTTHSPYFLDLVPLESIIVSEKTIEGNFFHLPKDEKSLAVWRGKFSPGKLYTMGRLTK